MILPQRLLRPVSNFKHLVLTFTAATEKRFTSPVPNSKAQLRASRDAAVAGRRKFAAKFRMKIAQPILIGVN